MNIVILIGKLGGDPELKHLPDGTACCKFSMAVTKKWKDKKGQKQQKVVWARIVAWRHLAEICAKYLVKGQEVGIQGELNDVSWEKDGVKHHAFEIIADKMKMMATPAKSDSADDDLPF